MITHLIDTSAAVRIFTNPEVRDRWNDHLVQGVVAVCDITEVEMQFSAQSLADRLDKAERIRQVFNWIPTPDSVFARVHRIQQKLTELGEHRSAGPVDLVVAAVAELSGLTLLHYDRDFEAVAEVCDDLTTAWVARPGAA